MKYRSKGILIVSIFATMTLIFLLTVNAVFAYFTSRSSANGNLTFGTLNVNYVYRTTTSGTSVAVNGDTLNLTPDSSQIRRGDTFSFKLLSDTGVATDTIESLQFRSSADSVEAYIRFRVNAYIVNSSGEVDTTTNYGQYFRLNYGSSYVTYENRTNNGETNTIYYVTRALPSNTTYTFANSMTLLNIAPIEILNTDVKITITFEAVQATNEAYKSVFNDGWGYLNEEYWT